MSDSDRGWRAFVRDQKYGIWVGVWLAIFIEVAVILIGPVIRSVCH